MQETARREKDRLIDFLKLIEELRAMKTRLSALDAQRLEEQHKIALESALKNLERKSRGAGPEELQKIQTEARRIADADYERSREIMSAKFMKIEAGLAGLQNLLQNLLPLKQLEDGLQSREEALKKAEEELNVRRKVLAHEQEDLEREKELLRAAEESLSAKTRELDEKLANLDVVRRAAELDALKADLDGKLKAYEEQMAILVRERDELNKDFEKQGEKKAEIEREAEAVRQERQKLEEERRGMADAVAREMAATFEAFVRDMLRTQA